MVAQNNGSVLKAFEILSLFRSGPDVLSAADLAARLSMNGVTAHRFLRTLERTGALVLVSKGRYRLGFTLVDLGERAADSQAIANVVQPVLEDLSRTLREGAMATVFDGEMVVCIAKAAPDRPLFVDVRRGTRLEAYCTAHGKLWLAQLGQEELERYLEAVERRCFTDTTRVLPATLLAEIEAVRRERVAFNEGEREAHIHGAAVPVETRSGRMVCGLSVYGPPARFEGAARAEIVAALRLAASKADRLLYGEAADRILPDPERARDDRQQSRTGA